MVLDLYYSSQGSCSRGVDFSLTIDRGIPGGSCKFKDLETDGACLEWSGKENPAAIKARVDALDGVQVLCRPPHF
jgi:hypothetical protein